ncbi:hypothetical protein [Acidovorax radicis]|uniref:hypothetical protein n=1 Tax=Acidovorax radicis TaxID=758826 RepID=UPI0039B02510|nr:hypothetical protein KI609_16380 [Acidovorax radicis]
MSTPSIPMPARAFHGTAVVRAAFLIALFGWGTGVYGPPVFSAGGGLAHRLA